MATPLRDEKHEILRKQVISKVHWGAGDDEVREFLDRHGINGAEADRLIAEALSARAREIRIRALLGLILYGLGFAVAAGFSVMALSTVAEGVIFPYTSIRALAMAGVALFCLWKCVRCGWRLLCGRTAGPIDHT